jgi:hypothetical protein
MEAPLWVVIVGFIVGPAVTAAIVNGVFQRQLNRQKTKLDEAVGKTLKSFEIDLKSQADKDLEDYKESIQQGLRAFESVLAERIRKRVELEDFVTGFQLALRKCYLHIFEEGKTAEPNKLLELTLEGIEMVMEHFRQRERQLRRETKIAVLAVANHLRELPLDQGPLAKATIDRFRASANDFFEKTERARSELGLELE